MKQAKKIHFVSIGGNVMEDLAIGLSLSGHAVTCSLDGLTADATARLHIHNIVPGAGWPQEKTDPREHTLIIGTHTPADSPELRRALELKVPVYSFPDFIYRESINKQRMVVVGSHGKTMITALIVHVLNYHKRSFDYIVGAHVKGLERTVRLSDAPLVVIEGQDVKSSPLDSTPVFLKYHHHIGVISGIEWKMSDAYVTEDEYIRQFDLFEGATPKGGVLVYFELDPVVTALSNMDRPDVLFVPYKTHASTIEGGKEFLITASKERIPVNISGKFNLQNLSAAKEALKKVGITAEMFYQAIPEFTAPVI